MSKSVFSDVRAGDVFLRMGQSCRVMAVTEGYVMARIKGCMPYFMNVNEFLETHTIVATSPTTEKGKDLKE